MRKKILRISSIVGLFIFAYLIYKIGPKQIWENINKITMVSFLMLFSMRFFYWALRTLSWKVILDQYEKQYSFFHIFTARMSSHAIAHLTPTATVGGEATRIMMVNSSSKKINIASVIVDKTIEFIVYIFFTIIGVAIAITKIRMPDEYKIVLIGFVFLSTILILFFISKQKKGLFTWIIRILEKIKIRFKIFERNKEKIEETDEYISDFYNKHKKVFIKVFLLYSLLFLFWTAEIHLTLMFIGAKDITFLESFLVVALGTVAFIFPIIPASIGIYEAANVAIFALLRLGVGIGFTMVLIRRIIALLWAGIGLFGMFRSKVK